MQLLLEQLGPYRLASMEAMLQAAECRASIEEDTIGAGSLNDSTNVTQSERRT